MLMRLRDNRDSESGARVRRCTRVITQGVTRYIWLSAESQQGWKNCKFWIDYKASPNIMGPNLELFPLFFKHFAKFLQATWSKIYPWHLCNFPPHESEDDFQWSPWFRCTPRALIWRLMWGLTLERSHTSVAGVGAAGSSADLMSSLVTSENTREPSLSSATCVTELSHDQITSLSTWRDTEHGDWWWFCDKSCDIDIIWCFQ